MKANFIFVFILTFNFCIAQSISNAKVDSLIVGIKQAIVENYVITEKITQISDSLQAKKYYQIKDIDSVMTKLNQDFFLYSNDKHLFIQYKPIVADNLSKKVDIYKEQNKKEKKEHYGFEKPKKLNGNIGYIKLNYFADATHARKKVLKYLSHLKKTEAIILDLRNNLGGNGTMLQLLTGIFLQEKDNEILKINYRSGRVVTMKSTQIDDSKKITKQPIYILCSAQTFSAGEAFALIMKNRGRAIIVGDTTAGAGNVAGPHPINNQFVLTIPVGIIVDPLTNKGWEHSGVTPNIKCEPTKALDKAIAEILLHM